MLTARELDQVEQVLVGQGYAFFHVSGAGHEASAALARHLTPHDWLHLHYRDKALLLARGVTVEEFIRSLICRSDSHSAGRQMSAHLSAPHLNVASMVGPVGNNALQAVGIAAAIKDRPELPIVVCSVGDGTTQEGEFLEAVAEVVRWQLPVMFLIEDNRYAISTLTAGKTFFDLPSGCASDFYGLPIHHLDGSDPVAVDAAFSELVPSIRDSRLPQLVVMHVERLTDHTNADDQSKYRDPADIAHSLKQADPLSKLRDWLLNHGADSAELDDLIDTVRLGVQEAVEGVQLESEPQPVTSAKAHLPQSLLDRSDYRGDDSTPRLTMLSALNGVLRHQLEADSRVFLYGQDIEDPKGDVFGVTRGLSSEFPDRVVNAPLSESTIVGTSVGRALAGQRPVAFLQFADFLPLAFNQIVSELGSMYWRTNGGWQCPVIVMVTCGGYKPGLGPFHAQTLESVLAHTPGIDVFMPSTAADAAGLLNYAFASTRPTIFLYPKSCLNLPEHATSPDVARHLVSPSTVRKITSGKDLTLVTWGNPVVQCEAAAKVLAEYGHTVDLFDLRSLSPWDSTTILESVEKTGRLVVVHEDNQTCGFGAEVLATIGERAKRPAQMRRIARPDTYVPCHYGNQLEVLPSFKPILETCADLLDCNVTWRKPPCYPARQAVIPAIGSGPADETVRVIDIRVQVGDAVTVGQVVAEVEATKSVVDVCASTSGVVLEISAEVGAEVRVNAPLIRLQLSATSGHLTALPITREDPGIPQLRRRGTKSLVAPPSTNGCALASKTVGIVDVVGLSGSRVVTNEELIVNWPRRTVEEIFKLTGIESRRWIDAAKGETVLGLAVQVTRQLLDQQKLTIHDVDLVIACTTTPDVITPSLACRIAAAVAPTEESPTLAAYDINAACSGYLYAIAQAYDYLQQQPAARVLVVTSEVLSPMLDMHNFDTAILFGDAATATLVVGSQHKSSWLRLHRPVVSGSPDANSLLSVPVHGAGVLTMHGSTIFKQAVRLMEQSLHQACSQSGISFKDLGVIVPHQANQRIIDAIADRMSRPALGTIRHHGNTSSSTIPLTLASIRHDEAVPSSIGLTAFGGGFTYASCMAEVAKNG